MPNFLVTWKMDVDDSDAGRPMTPRAAADYCHRVMLDPESGAVCFDVLDKETGRTTFVDLWSGDEPDIALTLSRARTLLDGINHWDGETEDARVAVIDAIDDAIRAIAPEPTWKPVLLNPSTELDKAMAALRKIVRGDACVMDDPHGLVEAAEAACDAHEALHWSKQAAAAMTGADHVD